MAATFPVVGSGAFDTTPSYSGSFIPALWSAKLNVKFYKATVFGEIANTNWEGEIKGMGDKITMEEKINLAMAESNLKIEGKKDNKWVPISDTLPTEGL